MTVQDRWGHALSRLGQEALELVSPTRCVCCEVPGAMVCPSCLASLVRIDAATCCARCGAPFGSLLCTECGHPEGDLPAGIDRCLAATVFDERSARCVRAYKDAGERGMAHMLAGAMLGAACAAQDADPARFSGLVQNSCGVTFVPATGAAFRRRGFDHMEHVARAFAAACGVPLVDTLVKQGASDQRSLSRSGRIEASRGAYRVVANVSGMRLLLLDDVITTGATMRSAALALKGAGAAHVDALAFARVWG